MMSDRSFALRARVVLPVCGPPIDGGIVTVRGGEIISVGKRGDQSHIIDLDDAVLLPGFVNAHTHLEFSDLASPLGAPGSSLPDWIREVIGHRRGAAGGVMAIAAGLNECLVGGTTTVGEIATSDWHLSDTLPAVRPRTVMFREAIGPTLPRAHAAGEMAEQFLQAARFPSDVLPGLSPHAPYTVHPQLLAKLVELSQRHRVPLAMHLAESREELELLNLSSGPFREMLEAVGAWDGAEEVRLSCTLDYLSELARAERALVIHGNYLDDDEIEFLAEHQDRMAVVYCPRTHAYFDHDPYPLAEMLAAGVTMALGTDSRASNPDLRMLGEIGQVASDHSGVRPDKILELATLGGARALGLADQIGTLEPGKRADLVAVEIRPAGSNAVQDLVLGESRAVGTWVAGVRVC
jgi:cytosine/adenosine deaminase-related metal-dependent hydrolase